MKEIMKEHGGLLVTVAVTICILTIIFSAVTDSDGNRGIVKIIAAHMNTDGTDYNAYADYGACFFNIFVKVFNIYFPPLKNTLNYLSVFIYISFLYKIRLNYLRNIKLFHSFS